jgi:RecA/RadA recombinase
MTKKPEKKPIEKKTFDNKAFKKDLGLGAQVVKEKELTWIPFKKAFHDAVGLPGVPRGYTTQFRGFSDVGKSTGIYESLAGAQKLGDYCIIIDTEGSFNWEHAKLVGFKFEEVADEETGEIVDYDGPDFMYFGGSDLLALYQNFDYKDAKMKTTPQRYIPVVEDIARLINEILDKQEKGEFPHNITFLWDSIGSINGLLEL